MEKHYVEFMYPGALVTETSVQEVSARDPTKIEAPENCFGYRFFDRVEGEIDGEAVVGKPKNYSGVHYFGTVKTLDDIKGEMPGSILQRNMEGNGWDKVVQTRMGNYQPLTVEDVVLAEK